MFCQKCGNKILDGGLFCTKCGAKVLAKTVSAVDAVKAEQSAEQKELIITKLQQLLPYVTRVERELAHISDLKSKMKEDYERKEMREEGIVNLFQRSAGIIVAVWIILFGIIAFLLCCIAPDWRDINMVITMVIATVLTVFIIKKFCSYLMDDTEYRMKRSQKEEELKKAEDDLQEYCKKSSVSSLLEIVPKEYCSKDAIEFLLRMFRNGRADTMKEAINLYEEYLYREDMKNAHNQHSEAIAGVSEQIDMQSQMIASQGRQLSEQMSGMERDLRKAKRATKVNTALSVYGMLKGK